MTCWRNQSIMDMKAPMNETIGMRVPSIYASWLGEQSSLGKESNVRIEAMRA